jgi:hypothetical protein
MFASFLLAGAGVAVPTMTQLPVVSGYAKCVTRNMGAVSVDPADRKTALDASVRTCRTMSERSYAEGKLLMNGKPFPKRWWEEVRKLLDAEDADIADVLLSGPSSTSYKVMWELPNGKLVGVGEQFMPGTIRVRILAA